MGKIEEVLDRAWEEVHADVIAQMKAHPDYQQLVQHIAELGVQQLVTLATTAVAAAA